MQVAGLQKTSMIDYPSKISAVIFTLGCNFRCPYCHNPDLITVNSSNSIFDEFAVFDFLKQRQGKLDAVVVSGGEPTLQCDLEGFLGKIKKMGFLTKLDTNGSNPNFLKKIIQGNLVDYVAMDIKAPLEKYPEIVCKDIDVKNIKTSIEYLINCGVDYEFRTTVVKSQLDFEDFVEIGQLLSGANKYYLQKFVNTVTLNPCFAKEETYNDEKFEEIRQILLKNIKEVFVR